MADQGFEHRHPIVVLPRANQPQVNRIIRRYGFLDEIQGGISDCDVFLSSFETFSHFRSFRS